jgi:hypothetical protein
MARTATMLKNEDIKCGAFRFLNRIFTAFETRKFAHPHTNTEKRALAYRGSAPILSKDFPDAGRRRALPHCHLVNMQNSLSKEPFSKSGSSRRFQKNSGAI